MKKIKVNEVIVETTRTEFDDYLGGNRVVNEVTNTENLTSMIDAMCYIKYLALDKGANCIMGDVHTWMYWEDPEEDDVDYRTRVVVEFKEA